MHKINATYIQQWVTLYAVTLLGGKQKTSTVKWASSSTRVDLAFVCDVPAYGRELTDFKAF